MQTQHLSLDAFAGTSGRQQIFHERGLGAAGGEAGHLN